MNQVCASYVRYSHKRNNSSAESQAGRLADKGRQKRKLAGSKMEAGILQKKKTTANPNERQSGTEEVWLVQRTRYEAFGEGADQKFG